MRYIDLTLPLYDKMPVYPGDPEVEIKQIHFLDKEGWNLRKLGLTTHLGTHVNVPDHMVAEGRNLSTYKISDFISDAVIYDKPRDVVPGVGVIFSTINIDRNIVSLLLNIRPTFVGLSSQFDFDLDLERELLEAGIISYENLVNTELLPRQFKFFGIPLNIKDADGSPVRAFAEVI